MEDHLGKNVVREHRASIALSNELPSDSPETKRKKRRCSMRQRRVDALLSTACGLVAAFGLYFACEQLLRVILCPVTSDETSDAVDEFGTPRPRPNSNETSDAVLGEFCDCTSGCPLQIIGLVPVGLAAVVPLVPALQFLWTHFTQVWPYLRYSMGDVLFQEAKKTSAHADLAESLGFMGKVKTEVEYLYDLLRTEQYHDKTLACRRPLRLCVMIDDLDRCPKEAIVKVLESVILLMVNAPITCWLGIDSRVVVASIEDHFGVRNGTHPLPCYACFLAYTSLIIIPALHQLGQLAPL